MNQNIVAYLLIVIFVLLVLAILQVIFIRFKFDTFSKEKILTELKIDEQLANNCPKNNLFVFNLEHNISLTKDINTPNTTAYNLMVPNSAHKVFFQYSCPSTSKKENVIKTYTTTLRNPFCLSLVKNNSSMMLQSLIKNSPLFFIVINSVLCVGYIDEFNTRDVQMNDIRYNDFLILNLYNLKDNSEYLQRDILTESSCSIMNFRTFIGDTKTELRDAGLLNDSYFCVLGFGAS
jgi:hypothetical protein